MTRVIWDGRGEIPAGAASFETFDGQLRGRIYVRARVRRALSRWRRMPGMRVEECLRMTVENDEWMGARNGYLVSALCREAESLLMRMPEPALRAEAL